VLLLQGLPAPAGRHRGRAGGHEAPLAVALGLGRRRWRRHRRGLPMTAVGPDGRPVAATGGTNKVPLWQRRLAISRRTLPIVISGGLVAGSLLGLLVGLGDPPDAAASEV